MAGRWREAQTFVVNKFVRCTEDDILVCVAGHEAADKYASVALDYTSTESQDPAQFTNGLAVPFLHR